MKAILACDPKGGIGKDNKLPWDRLDGDLKRFKELTDGERIVMGRNTWDSLPVKPLPNRYHWVMTTHGEDLKGYKNVTQLLNDVFLTDDVWLIGGATLFKQQYNKINTLHLSVTYSVYDCDTYIDLDKIYQDFELQSRTEHSDHAYEILKRK
jgi:dihydrofolate reductase